MGNLKEKSADFFHKLSRGQKIAGLILLLLLLVSGFAAGFSVTGNEDNAAGKNGNDESTVHIEEKVDVAAKGKGPEDKTVSNQEKANDDQKEKDGDRASASTDVNSNEGIYKDISAKNSSSNAGNKEKTNNSRSNSSNSSRESDQTSAPATSAPKTKANPEPKPRPQQPKAEKPKTDPKPNPYLVTNPSSGAIKEKFDAYFGNFYYVHNVPRDVVRKFDSILQEYADGRTSNSQFESQIKSVKWISNNSEWSVWMVYSVRFTTSTLDVSEMMEEIVNHGANVMPGNVRTVQFSYDPSDGKTTIAVMAVQLMEAPV